MKYLIIFSIILSFIPSCTIEDKCNLSNLDIYLKDKKLSHKKLLYNSNFLSYTESTIFDNGHIYFYRKYKLTKSFSELDKHNFRIRNIVYRISDQNGTIVREECQYQKPTNFNRKWVRNLSCKDKTIILSKKRWAVGKGEFASTCHIKTAKNKVVFGKKRKIIKAICKSKYGDIIVYYAEGLGVIKSSEGSTYTTLVKILG